MGRREGRYLSFQIMVKTALPTSTTGAATMRAKAELPDRQRVGFGLMGTGSVGSIISVSYGLSSRVNCVIYYPETG